MRHAKEREAFRALVRAAVEGDERRRIALRDRIFMANMRLAFKEAARILPRRQRYYGDCASGLLDGRGWRITTDNVGDGSGGSEMEIDFLKVRKKATFMELEIRKETFVGGNQNYSPAGSIIYRVDYMDEDGNAINWTELNAPFLLKNIAFLGDIYNYAARRMVIHKMQDGEWAQVHHFRCYLLADDGTTATRNWWRAGDQVRSQTFNRALSSKDKQAHTYDAGGQPVEDPATPMPARNPNPSKPVETSYYWRLCSNTGSEKLEDGKVYDYIDLRRVVRIHVCRHPLLLRRRLGHPRGRRPHRLHGQQE